MEDADRASVAQETKTETACHNDGCLLSTWHKKPFAAVLVPAYALLLILLPPLVITFRPVAVSFLRPNAGCGFRLAPKPYVLTTTQPPLLSLRPGFLRASGNDRNTNTVYGNKINSVKKKKPRKPHKNGIKLMKSL